MITQLGKFADRLIEAEVSKIGTKPVTAEDADITSDEAYQIQLEIINRKIDQGQKIVGKKIGLTSKAMQEMLGVNEPDYGHLLNSMMVENSGTLSINDVLQPKVEGEIAFILKEELKGPNITTLDVLQATDYIVPALEIVDSRIKDWEIKLQDTIADNASSGFYCLGDTQTRIDEIDLAQIGMVFMKNNELVNTGVGAAALGHPASCVAWLANKLANFDISLKAGEVILSGALSAAVSVEEGDTFTARFAHIGEVSVSFGK